VISLTKARLIYLAVLACLLVFYLAAFLTPLNPADGHG
jgi:hypothetical protein